MNTIELFCGTKSFSEVMRTNGHETLTYDNEPSLEPDRCVDILAIGELHPTAEYMGKKIDVLWSSPPCQGFSVAVIGRNWNHDYTPKTDSARLAMMLAQKTISMIEANNPTWWFIENPRGMLRKMPFMEEFLKRTGGYGTQLRTVSTETRGRSQPTFGRTLRGGSRGVSASREVRVIFPLRADPGPVRRASRAQRIEDVSPVQSSRRYSNKCRNNGIIIL